MHRLTLAELNDEVVRNGFEIGPVLDHFLGRIDRFSALNALISVKRTHLRVNRPRETAPGALNGVPIAIKDLIDIEGRETTAASRLLSGQIAREDAGVVVVLRQSGAFLIGKTNLHEFAYGGSGVISAYGPVKNPWNVEHITGGSSSGSAAAMAAGLCAAAIGTDTAGSIRLPASCCGIVGFKPSFGAVSNNGVIPLATSYDHVGPMTRSVPDAQHLFGVLVGQPSRRPKPVTKLRVGIPEAYFYRDLDASVARVMDDVLHTLRAAGHQIARCEFEVDEDRTLSSYEAYVYHQEWVKQSPELYQPETLRRIKSGEKITAEAAQEAAMRLQALRAGASAIFDGIDVLLTPTCPILPPRIADLVEKPETLRPTELLMLRNTRPFNVLGVPAISLPWDLSGSGLPIGIQLAWRRLQDFELLGMAAEFEKMAPWQGRVAPGFE